MFIINYNFINIFLTNYNNFICRLSLATITRKFLFLLSSLNPELQLMKNVATKTMY